ncbi:FAD-dependent monooxygenase [Burkholderiaceae bacterium DAT-1]|nr:FAD-dependent monooxygenase [Burkholderiaceae bacterium DAT-1]
MLVSELPSHVDLLIVGGGPVGGALALLLADAGLSIAVVEARAEPARDPRALAIAYATRQCYDQLGVQLGDAGTAIRTVHVSQEQAFGRVKLDCSELELPELGEVMPYGVLATAIDQRLRVQTSIHYLTGAKVEALQSLDGYAVASIQRGESNHTVTAGMAVLAEGGNLLAGLGIQQRVEDYHQTAVLADITTSQPHGYVAWERFAHDGPIAFLPRGSSRDGQYAVVWTRPAEDELDVFNLPDADFIAALQARIGDRIGRIESVGERAQFPLKLRWAEQVTARRVAVVGNASQTLHPVAGQGLNLGLRDAQTLARVIRTTRPDQLGQSAMLAEYARLRKRDSMMTIGFTDNLIRLFGLDSAPLRHARALGFVALDNVKPLRRAFAGRMVFGSI